MQTTHFKVNTENCTRRFETADLSYIAVRNLVAALFGLDVTAPWVLQYTDKENQLVTITSDEHLTSACQLREKVVRLQVALNGEAPVKKDKREKKDKRDKKERKPRSIACLTKKQTRILERISTLSEEESPKAKSQVEKLEKKLAEVTSELKHLSIAFGVGDSNSSNVPTSTDVMTAPAVVDGVAPMDITVPSANVNPVTPFDQQLLKEVSTQLFGLRREVHQERKRVQSLSKVIKALQVLSRHGADSDFGIQVSSEQVDQSKASLSVAKEEFSAKKAQLKNQAQLLKALRKQQKEFLGFKKEKKGNGVRKSHKGKDGWKVKKERKEKTEKKEKKSKRMQHDHLSSSFDKLKL